MRRKAIIATLSAAAIPAIITAALSVTVGTSFATRGSQARSSGAMPVAATVDLRGHFEQLLGYHVFTAIRLMRAVVAAKPDFRTVATSALNDNTAALSDAIGGAYGSAQGQKFRQVWTGHVTDLLAYANAVAAKDSTAAGSARSRLETYATSFGQWYAALAAGGPTAAQLAASTKMHVDELMAQLDAYARGDYATSFADERMAFEHMFAAARALTAGTTPELAVGANSPPRELRSRFTMLLGEHMEFAVEATRAALSGSAAEFHAATQQLDANTTALTRGIAAVAGDKNGATFSSIYGDHIDALVAYTAATAKKDAAAKKAARARLDAVAVRLGAYFRAILGSRISADTVTKAFLMHDAMLVDSIDSYAVKDYARAQTADSDGYNHMVGVAGVLVDAIEGAITKALPKGAAQTGGGGMARVVGGMSVGRAARP